MTFTLKDFFGAVAFKEWSLNPATGHVVRVLVGQVSILQDKELLGFETRERESNWVARVVGPSGEAWNVPGCQVRNVTAYPEGKRGMVSTGDVLVIP